MQGAISLLSRIDGFTARRLSGYGRHSLIACGGANKLLFSLKDQLSLLVQPQNEKVVQIVILVLRVCGIASRRATIDDKSIFNKNLLVYKN